MSGNAEREGQHYRVYITREHQRLLKVYLPYDEYKHHIICYKRFINNNILYRLKFRIWMDGRRPGDGFIDCVMQKYSEIKGEYQTLDVVGQTKEPSIKNISVDGISVMISYIFEASDENWKLVSW